MQKHKETAKPDTAFNLSGVEKKDTILIVDDHQTIRTIMRHFLKEAGYEILEAANGREALAILERNPNVCVILMDIMMPDVDGLTLTKKIKQKADRYAIPMVIIISARSDRESVLKSVLSGAVDYIVKPFQRATVLEKIKKAIEIHKKGKQET